MAPALIEFTVVCVKVSVGEAACGILVLKNMPSTDEPIFRAEIGGTDTENRLVGTAGEGEGGMI